MSYSIHRTLALSLALASFAAVQPALAGSVTFGGAGEVLSTSIAYSPADLTTQSGAKAMWDRIQRASNVVCGGAPDARVLAERTAFDKCRAESQTRAINALNAPLVTAMAAHAGAVILARQ
jgi:UrcA family protein